MHLPFCLIDLKLVAVSDPPDSWIPIRLESGLVRPIEHSGLLQNGRSKRLVLQGMKAFTN